MTGRAEGNVRDALDFVARVGTEVGREMRFRAALAEINAAGQLAHDQEIRVLGDVGPQRRHVVKSVEHLRRAKIGEKTQLLAQPQKARFRTNGAIIPLIAAHGAEQDCVRVAAGFERLSGQRIAVAVDRHAAKIAFGKVETEVALGRQLLEAAHSLGRDLRANPVTGQYDNVNHAAWTFLAVALRSSRTACALLTASM